MSLKRLFIGAIFALLILCMLEGSAKKTGVFSSDKKVISGTYQNDSSEVEDGNNSESVNDAAAKLELFQHPDEVYEDAENSQLASRTGFPQTDFSPEADDYVENSENIASPTPDSFQPSYTFLDSDEDTGDSKHAASAASVDLAKLDVPFAVNDEAENSADTDTERNVSSDFDDGAENGVEEDEETTDAALPGFELIKELEKMAQSSDPEKSAIGREGLQKINTVLNTKGALKKIQINGKNVLVNMGPKGSKERRKCIGELGLFAMLFAWMLTPVRMVGLVPTSSIQRPDSFASKIGTVGLQDIFYRLWYGDGSRMSSSRRRTSRRTSVDSDESPELLRTSRTEKVIRAARRPEQFRKVLVNEEIVTDDEPDRILSSSVTKRETTNKTPLISRSATVGSPIRDSVTRKSTTGVRTDVDEFELGPVAAESVHKRAIRPGQRSIDEEVSFRASPGNTFSETRTSSRSERVPGFSQSRSGVAVDETGTPFNEFSEFSKRNRSPTELKRTIEVTLPVSLILKLRKYATQRIDPEVIRDALFKKNYSAEDVENILIVYNGILEDNARIV